jgi:pimeloyl-ACP methyl ester carboxylesterase
VLAPPNPLRGVAFDAGVVSDVVKAIGGPVVLVGHSYGGAVIGQASAGLENVTGLVFLAAFGLEAGESCASVQQPFPPPLLATTVAPTPYDAPGAAGRRRRSGRGRGSAMAAPAPCREDLHAGPTAHHHGNAQRR